MDVHSYEQNAVNLLGWLFASAMLTFFFQMGAGHRRAHKRFHGRPAVQAYEVRKGPLNLGLVVRVL